jgi:ferredoxin-type protein NapF
MTTSVSRASLLRGRLREPGTVLRPPWARSEAVFSNLCDACDACREACPEGIIEHGSGRLPVIDFRGGGCTFCRRCLEACPTGALSAAVAPPWPYQARIGSGCLAARGIVCRLCAEHCESRAIRFRLVVGGAAVADIDAGACNGCGACVGVCPNDSIRIERQS